MEENNQDKIGSKPATEDVKWIFNKRRKLWVPLHKKQRRKVSNDKSTFNWINLLGALAVPFVVLVIGLYFTQQFALQQVQIAENQQQDLALESYLDNMSNLLLNGNLPQSKPGAIVRNVVRIQTLTVLRRIDPDRKVIVLRFLFEANLISNISLDDADLSGINLKNLRPIGNDTIRDFSLQFAILTHADIENYQVENSTFGYTNLSYSALIGMKIISSDFSHANFSHIKISDTELSNCSLVGAELSYANLSHVNLSNTDLSGANLKGAELSYVDLRVAKSLKGTIMPDGSTHP